VRERTRLAIQKPHHGPGLLRRYAPRNDGRSAGGFSRRHCERSEAIQSLITALDGFV